MENNLSVCHCGSKPKLKKRSISHKGGIKYFYYDCQKCSISTFATRLPEFCLELWNSTIKKQKELKTL